MAEKQTAKKQALPSGTAQKKTTTPRKKTTDGSVRYKQKEQYEGYEPENEGEETEQKPKRSRSQSGAGKKTAGGSTRQKKEPVNVFEESERSRRMVHQIMPYVLIVLAVFTVICFLLIDVFTGADATRGVGSAGQWIRDVFCGLFGVGAFFVPVALALLAVGWRRAVEKNALLAKNLYAILSVLMLSAFLHAVLRINDAAWHFSDGLGTLWKLGVSLGGGGVVGGLLGELLKMSGIAGSIIIGVTFTALFVILLCGVTPNYVITTIRYKYKIWREKSAEAAKLRREEKAEAAEEARIEREARRAAAEEQKQIAAAEREAKREQLALEAAERKAQLRALEEAEAKHAEQKQTEPKPVISIRPADEEPAKPEAKREIKVEPKPEIIEQPAEYDQQESVPLIIIPPKEENHTEKGKTVAKNDEDDGVYHSAEEIAAVRSRTSSDDEFSLNDIFKNDKPLTEADKNKLNRKPVKEGADGNASELDMKLLADMKPITDIDEIPDLEDGIEEIAVEAETPKEEEYVFPPIDLLAEDTNAKNEDVTAELVENAQKLMDTLKSFKVGIKEITYSRGPTITRYELKPDVGIRVRSIANLVDDIALSLATTGVRIEAPIPNKPAVGIEVPNQNPNTVFLRSLIDTEKFASESSKLTACLGADVAGKPMYFNIAKMPHLLIAGATGMGKSVCINSIIVSLLYKARPDEVKLILIDPKKVEFNIYKDIPHLYAPIVSEPAKAAGALASAVAEMERRFELIEEVGVRDIYNYNAVTKDDPDREFMPQMVIIIDELADLMMTAPDAVESSICRLAQKARAAGIHIIIGTQRPSVDVITGLIKANVPSRIAFTVASQVDSRTIIDIAGAEKLIGRGDMLFAPVGAAKPMRVQGAFVHESEVEKIVEFIKSHNRGAKYNDEFMSRIEEEAAKCTAGNKKGGGGGSMPDGDMDSDGLDLKFREAVKVAVETGRVATSLLQRKLEIGYGRAAKIIDQMEEMGYVSAPEGNKPRKILISKEDFMQMSINDDI